MSTLFSYCIMHDSGAAPNPYWGVCTLNICKPVIRRKAKQGDWIIATGSSRYGFEHKVVYAMKVTQKMTMKEYYFHCINNKTEKIPNCNSSYEKAVGDSIYDFSNDRPRILESVHTEDNRETDLGGLFTLLSTDFYYFGKDPEPLPEHLLPVVKQGRGHKSTSNQPYLNDILGWIRTQSKAHNKIYSPPYERQFYVTYEDYRKKCSDYHKQEDNLDEEEELDYE